MLARNDEDVPGEERAVIEESEEIAVGVDLVGREIAARDSAKDALFGRHAGCFAARSGGVKPARPCNHFTYFLSVTPSTQYTASPSAAMQLGNGRGGMNLSRSTGSLPFLSTL